MYKVLKLLTTWECIRWTGVDGPEVRGVDVTRWGKAREREKEDN